MMYVGVAIMVVCDRMTLVAVVIIGVMAVVAGMVVIELVAAVL